MFSIRHWLIAIAALGLVASLGAVQLSPELGWPESWNTRAQGSAVVCLAAIVALVLGGWFRWWAWLAAMAPSVLLGAWLWSRVGTRIESVSAPLSRAVWLLGLCINLVAAFAILQVGEAVYKWIKAQTSEDETEQPEAAEAHGPVEPAAPDRSSNSKAKSGD